MKVIVFDGYISECFFCRRSNNDMTQSKGLQWCLLTALALSCLLMMEGEGHSHNIYILEQLITYCQLVDATL